MTNKRLLDRSGILSLDTHDGLKARYVQFLHKRRQAVLMELGEIDDQLIEAGELAQRTVTPHRTRRAGRYRTTAE